MQTVQSFLLCLYDSWDGCRLFGSVECSYSHSNDVCSRKPQKQIRRQKQMQFQRVIVDSVNCKLVNYLLTVRVVKSKRNLPLINICLCFSHKNELGWNVQNCINVSFNSRRPYLVMSYLVMSYRVIESIFCLFSLSYLILPYLTLSYLVLPYLHLFSFLCQVCMKWAAE